MEKPTFIQEYVSKDLTEKVLELKNKIEYFPERKDFTIELDFEQIKTLNPEFANTILDAPMVAISQINSAVKRHVDSNDLKNIFVKFNNLTDNRTRIWEIRYEQLNKMLFIEAYILAITSPTLEIESITYECPACGNSMNVNRKNNIIQEPSKCGCGRKGKFRVFSRQFFNRQKMIIAEGSEKDSKKNRSLVCYLDYAMAETHIDKSLLEGNKISLYGVLKDEEVNTKNGKEFVYRLKVNNIKVIDEGFDQMEITEEEKKRIIKEAHTEGIINRLKDSIFPRHKYDEDIKEGLILAVAGSKKIKDEYITEDTGNIHVLLAGDHGSGKSNLAKRILCCSPKAMFQSASNATVIGLTAAIKKNEILGEVVAEPGLLPLCNKGIAAIDEMDKIFKDDLGKLNSALSDGFITVLKGGVRTEFETDTILIGCMNPEFKNFSEGKNRDLQINLSPDLKDRFTLIFPVMTKTNVSQRREIAYTIGSKYLTKEKEECDEEVKGPFTIEFIRKYFALIRRHNPEIKKEALEYLIKSEEKISQDGSKSHRLIEKLIKLSIAYARIEYSENVENSHIDKAFRLMLYSLAQRQLLTADGKYDLNKEFNIDTADEVKKKIKTYELIVKTLDNKKSMPHEDIYKLCFENNGIDEVDFEREIEKLKRDGTIFESPRGSYRRLI